MVITPKQSLEWKCWSQEADTNTCHFNGFYAGITNDAIIHVGTDHCFT